MELADTPNLASFYCPGCSPGRDPFEEILTVRWCDLHQPRYGGSDDDRAKVSRDLRTAAGDAGEVDAFAPRHQPTSLHRLEAFPEFSRRFRRSSTILVTPGAPSILALRWVTISRREGEPCGRAALADRRSVVPGRRADARRRGRPPPDGRRRGDGRRRRRRADRASRGASGLGRRRGPPLPRGAWAGARGRRRGRG